MILFADCETTGLDPQKSWILEVAAILVDDKLEEIARFHRVVKTSVAYVALHNPPVGLPEFDVDPFVHKMHLDNGLWKESSEASLWAHEVDLELSSWLKTHCVSVGQKVGPQLGGSTIDFDRAFFKQDLPKTFDMLHYRNVDVSTLNEMAKRFWPDVYTHRVAPLCANHRAAGDVYDSLQLARYYSRSLLPCVS